MAVEEPNVRAEPGPTDGRARLVEVIRWLFLAALVLDLVGGLITLPRASSLSELQRDLGARQVRSLAFDDGNSLGSVRLVREGSVLGSSRDGVVWRTGTLSYKSAPMDLGSDFGSPAKPVETKDQLRERITAVAGQADVPIRSKADQDLFGRWSLVVILVYLVVLVTLIWGEQPRRTTKWATFW
jgi:hypothetical protein